MTTLTETRVIPFTVPAAFPAPAEPEVERLRGWRLLAVWVGLVVGSWAITIALAALIWWAVRAVAAGI